MPKFKENPNPMGSGFKMKGPTFFQKSMKKYSPVNQGTELPAGAGGENIESMFGGAIGSGPTSGPVDPTQDQAAMSAQIADEKMTAAGGRKWKPGGSPTTQKSPTKQGKWGMYNPDMNPKPLPGQPGSNQLGAATPQKSPTKQRPAKTEAGSGGQTTINKEEAKAARAAQGGPIEQKSPAKQGPTADEIKKKYGNYKDYKKAVAKGHVKKGSLGETS